MVEASRFSFGSASPSLSCEKEFLIMASSNATARAPERQPETNSTPRTVWPRQAKKPARFVIKVVGQIPF